MTGRAFAVPMILTALILFLLVQGVMRSMRAAKTKDRLKDEQEAARQRAAERRLELEKQIREKPKTAKSKRRSPSADMNPAPIDPDF